jgi:Isy1-like splicing family
MLYRFREQQAAERGLIDTNAMRRPKVITQVDSIPVCEKWRGACIRQISRLVTKIQDRRTRSFPIPVSFLSQFTSPIFSLRVILLAVDSSGCGLF